MIERLKPYPEYKDSGFPWLGRVPEHWDVRRIKTVLRECDRRSLDGAGTLLSLTRLRGLISRKDVTDKIHSAKTLVGYKLFTPGQIVMNRMQAWSGMFGAGNMQGMVSPDYAVFEVLGGHNSKLILERIKSPDMVEQFALESKGIGSGFNRLYTDRFGQISISLPPFQEQVAIVRFLDHATHRLDKAIRAKRKTISLLNEQKQAIIHRAVTRGLNPDVLLKDSGIPLLGQIPAHWDTPLNQRIFKEEIRPHGDVPETQLSLSQKDGLIATKDMQERSLQTASFNNWKVTVPGDLVLNRFKAHLGVFFASTLRGIVSFHYGVFAPRRELHSKYFELLFHTYPYRAIYAGRSNGMTVGLQNLSNQNFYNVRCVVPPFSEQVEIVTYAEQETQELNTAIFRIEREIDLLREYRTRLIADVVTGKLDVREAAACLPEEAPVDGAEEMEVADEELIEEEA